MSVDSINRSLFFPLCRLDDPTSEMRFDNFSQIDGLSTNNPIQLAPQPMKTVVAQQPTPLINNTPLVNNSMSTSNVVGATVVNPKVSSPDTVTLETDDGFFNIKASGDPTAVSKVFSKLEDSMGKGKGGARGVVGGAVGTVGGVDPNAANTAKMVAGVQAAAGAKEAASEAKTKAAEDKLDLKKKADEAKVETDKKKTEADAEEKKTKAKKDIKDAEEEGKKKTDALAEETKVKATKAADA